MLTGPHQPVKNPLSVFHFWMGWSPIFSVFRAEKLFSGEITILQE